LLRARRSFLAIWMDGPLHVAAVQDPERLTLR
jgi:hypothetical protein